ncbi:MAG: hypothetical protein NQU42_07040 [Methanothrix sp.]|uniref:hypothetical protein n=1 Tax=Methanothrix sp. TaxID=90426 RepID=UPI0025D86010|nr:hypothetical protein [Methanothrix sp.]MCQ8903827.1 hypothetical protein [Methanothrix sp.]
MISRPITFISILLIAFGLAHAVSVPTGNLPAGFKLLGVIDSNTTGVNISEEITDFYGAKDIGSVKDVSIGKYIWGEMGVDYDAKITILSLEDAAYARAAYENYRSRDEFKYPPVKGIDRFSNATINGHDALEIRDLVSDLRGRSIRFLYLWTNSSSVVLVEGNGSRESSMALAAATGM